MRYKRLKGVGLARRYALFVYSKDDELWKDHIVDSLDLNDQQVQIETWRDDARVPDVCRRPEGLGSDCSALLLLTPSFVDSAPIRDQILPQLVKVGERTDFFLLWLESCPLGIVENFGESRLLSAGGKPLERAEDSDRTEFFTILRKRLGQPCPISEARTTSLEKQALYRKLFDQYYRGVFNFFARRGFNTEDCRDLSQETFLKVYQGLDSYRNEAAYPTWIRAIMRNLWLNHLREVGARKRQASEISLEQIIEKVELPDRQSVLRDRWLDPEEQFLDAETRDRLRAAVRELPPQARRCQLLQLKGLKYREIAAVLGISIQAVRSHLFQARQRLEQILKEASAPRSKR